MATIEQIFRPRKNVADTVLQQTLQAVADSLGNRGQAKRSQARDNEIFGPVTAAMVETFNAGEVHLAIKLADGCYKLAKQHEAATGSEIHKGAITFDLGLMYLAIDDFRRAVDFLTKATAANPKPLPADYLVLALAHARLKQTDQAREACGKAAERLGLLGRRYTPRQRGTLDQQLLDLVVQRVDLGRDFGVI